jgi:IclR family transcriptional regulator, mhp operon transcriptional activator
MAASKAIRSLERGLQVLRALQEKPIASLHDIHQSTRISKPSLLRILYTLERAGVVSRRLADGQYRISANLSQLARKPDRYDRVAEAAAPVLDRLCRKVSWPSDLMVPAGDHMEIRESSRVRTPFSIYFMHDRIGTPVNWVLSAVGRAYLAYCPEQEREKILALLRKSQEPEDRLARDPKRLERILAETRIKGYGTRDPTFGGGAYRRQTPDGLAGIAVPLLDGGRVHGVINIIWAKAARQLDDMVRDNLGELQNAAAEIVESLRNQRRGR